MEVMTLLGKTDAEEQALHQNGGGSETEALGKAADGRTHKEATRGERLPETTLGEARGMPKT